MASSKTKKKTVSIVFEKIEGSVVILCKNGVYQQTEAWIRKDEVFCKYGAGYASLRKHNTSVNGLQLVDYDLGDLYSYAYTELGRMVTSEHPKASEPTESSYTRGGA
jgi:hypothetical protein